MNGTNESVLNPTQQFINLHLRFDKTVTNASGSLLVTDDNQEYLDFTSQCGALPFGHQPKYLKRRIEEYFSNSEPSIVQPLRCAESESLANRLVELSPLQQGYCSFCNSASEAVEIAIELAQLATGRRPIVATQSGRSPTDTVAPANKARNQPFLNFQSDCLRVTVEDINELDLALSTTRAAAFIIELVQGEGDMHVVSREYLAAASRLCQANGTLLVVDEAQTGLGRLGQVFGLSNYRDIELEPDIICLANALGGGLVPLAAVLCKSPVWSEHFGLFHSSSLTNNNFCCAIGNKTLDFLLQRDHLSRIEKMGQYLSSKLTSLTRQFPAVFNKTCGYGLLQGIELQPFHPNHSYFLSLINFHGLVAPLICGYLFNRHNILATPTSTNNYVIRVEPALDIDRNQIDALADALAEVAERIVNRRYASLFSYLIDLKPETVAYAEADITSDPILPLPRAGQKCLGSFAFFIHPTMIDDLMENMPEAINNLCGTHRTKWIQWLDSWVSKYHDPAAVLSIPAVVNADGDYVNGWLISCPLTPAKMMRLKKPAREHLMQGYFKIAENLSADIVGLGAFTSIVTRGGTCLPEHSIPVTTGNSLTGIVVAEGLIKAMQKRYGDLDQCRAGMIGAAGAVGSIAAIQVSRYLSDITLFGNPKNPNALGGLTEVRDEIYWRAFKDWQQGITNATADKLMEILDWQELPSFVMPFLEIPEQKNFTAIKECLGFILRQNQLQQHLPVKISVSLADDLSACDGVASMTGNGKAFVNSAHLRHGAVICDAARPPDFADSLKRERPDAVAFEGGLIKLFQRLQFGKSNILGFESDVNLTCLSETIILAMNQATQDFSLGKRLDIDIARSLYADAIRYGFSVPDTDIGAPPDEAPLQTLHNMLS